MNTASDYSYIDTSEALSMHIKRLDPASPLFIDCEFQSEGRYFPKPCLLQVADNNTGLLIDPLGDINLDPLIALLRNPMQLKVFHSGEQDLQIFNRLGAGWLSPVFDTQLAGAFLGFGPAISYGDLVYNTCRKRIAKQSQATNWLQRPLKNEQLAYAYADVFYLRTVYNELSKRLKEYDRLSWVEEIWQERSETIKDLFDPELSWQRLKLKSRYKKVLPLIKEIANWREHVAQKRNSPRMHVMSDHAILEICDTRPKTRDDFKRLRFFPANILNQKSNSERVFYDLQGAIERGSKAINNPQEMEADQHKYPAKELTSKRDQARLDLIRLLLRDNARKHNVAANYIARESDLVTFVTQGSGWERVQTGWRKEVFGHDASRVLSGDLAASVGEKGLEWINVGESQPD